MRDKKEITEKLEILRAGAKGKIQRYPESHDELMEALLKINLLRWVLGECSWKGSME